MKKVLCTFVLVPFTLLASANVLSQADNTSEDPFSGKVTLGFDKKTGNIDAQGFKYGLKLTHKMAKNEAFFKIKGKNAEVNDKTFQEDLTISLLDVYSLTKTSAVYGKITYLENEFQGYEHQWKLGAGYLHTWLEEDEKSFKTRLGYQARFSEYTTGEDDSQNFLLVGFRSSGYPIMENISIDTEFNYEANFTDLEDYETDFELSFVFKVNRTIDLKLDYKVEYDNVPVAGIEKTDNSISTNLVYKF
jgi:putative salt-induced outer membrane protein YdiY